MAQVPGGLHFAVIGDAEADIHVIARRPEDRWCLLRQFQARESTGVLGKGAVVNGVWYEPHSER